MTRSSAAQLAIIGLGFYFLQETDLESDRVFKETIRTAKTPIVIGAVNRGAETVYSEAIAPSRSNSLPMWAARGDIALDFAEDNVTRRTYDASKNPEYPETFARLIARLAGRMLPECRRNCASGGCGAHAATRSLPDDRGARPSVGTAEMVCDLQEQLKGSIVLRHGQLALHRPRPDAAVGRHQEACSAVMIHAQMIAQLLDNRIYSELGLRAMAGFLAGVILVGLTLGWIFWKHASLLGQCAAAVALVSLDAVLYYVWRIICR